jgi:small conductance mechanosensitive channel
MGAVRFCLLIAIIMALGSAAGLPEPANAQIPGLPNLSSGSESSGAALPVGVTRQGQTEIAGVHLDGRELFKIASPMVPDRAQPGNLIPVEVRAADIEARMQRLFSREVIPGDIRDFITHLDPKTFRIRIGTKNGQPVLSASDANAAPEELVTVTDADAQYAGLPARELAQSWQDILEQELRTALEKRQPAATRTALLRAAVILLASVVTSAFLAWLLSVLRRRKTLLSEQQQKAEAATASQAAESQAAASTASADAGVSSHAVKSAALEESRQRRLLAHLLHRQTTFGRRHQMVRLARAFVSWAIIFIWLAAIAGSLYQFPATRGAADRIVSIPVLILIAGFAAALLSGIAGLLIDLLVNATARSGNPRRSLRIPTIVAALKGLTAVVLYGTATIIVLDYVLIIPFTVVAFGAIAGLALSFAAQSLVKDVVNGILILVEDQYALGDHIVLGGEDGIVERLNLRITQIRASDGRLITIPNHVIERVENRTRLWSRVDLKVAVDYATDVDRAIAVVEKAVTEIEQDPRWRNFILAPHEMLGVDELSHAGIIIRFRVQTLPFKKEDIARELRRRLKIAFDREAIRIGIPQQAFIVEAAQDQPKEPFREADRVARREGDLGAWKSRVPS